MQTTRTLKPTDLALDRRLQLAIAGDDDLTAQALDAKIGVGGAALFCDGERRVGEAIERQREEGGIDGARVMEPRRSVYV